MSSTASPLPTPAQVSVPHFVFIEPARVPGGLIEHWEGYIKNCFPSDLDAQARFTVIDKALEELEDVKCDCMVSPANSFGIMDGSYDHVLSRGFMGPEDNYWLLTDQVQSHLREHWHGYLPPGSCAIVPMPDIVSGTYDPSTKTGNKWGATSLACLPTMRVPDDMSWHQDLVYNCMWSLLAAIEDWNKKNEEKKIKTVLMTGLATGCGAVPWQKCAAQMVLAIKHFGQSSWAPEHPRWNDVVSRQKEIQETIELGEKSR